LNQPCLMKSRIVKNCFRCSYLTNLNAILWTSLKWKTLRISKRLNHHKPKPRSIERTTRKFWKQIEKSYLSQMSRDRRPSNAFLKFWISNSKMFKIKRSQSKSIIRRMNRTSSNLKTFLRRKRTESSWKTFSER
jgi:hypothetical protein